MGATGVKIGDLQSPINAAAQFVGGKSPLKYEITTAIPDSDSTFKAVIDKNTGMVTVTLRNPALKNPDNDAKDWIFDANDSSVFTVTATDANSVIATKEFVILFNRKPVLRNVESGDDLWKFAVGTTDQTTSKKVVEIETIFPPYPGTIADSTHFTDHYSKGMTYTLREVDGKIKVTQDPKDDKKFTVEGITSTYHKNPSEYCKTDGTTLSIEPGTPKGTCIDTDAPSTPAVWTPGDIPVTFKVRATDGDKEFRDGTATVTVNEAPKLSTNFESLYTVEVGAPTTGGGARDGNNVIGDVKIFFSDREGDTIAADTTVKTSSLVHATAVVSSAGVLQVTGVNPGMATLTISVKSPIGTGGADQTTTADINVRVVPDGSL